ncbi:uncharacterized protein LOC128728691 [Anopheles nili]|uniref:uncharacterized protein LOC128728691 n=1 Tax=Anopheles nili TaxID=185578 RepID=UPI00237AFCEE|nr:uncharacterized protein LOC128728691 [Anopheles nili]
MAQQKFFSGLTEGMINRAAGERPDRQKTHFYWPDEYAPEPVSPINERQPLNRTESPPRLNQHSTPEPRERTPKHAESHIRLDDGVGSSFGELERTRAHERFRIEQFLRQQSEEDTGEAARAKRLSTLQSKIEFYDYCSPPAGTPRTRVARTRTPGNGYGGTPGSDHMPENGYDDTFGGGVDELDGDDRSVCSSASGHRSQPEVPEHKRNSQRHLRSSINFHNGCATADESEISRKPLSVRDSATTRVGVGLPNL